MQGPYSHMPPNVPNYMNEYASAYMHPTRNPIMPPYHHRPPPGITSSSAMMPPQHSNNGFFYQNNVNHGPPPLHQSIPQQPTMPGPFSNLIDVSQYDSPSNVECARKQSENIRKPAIAVQKGNVLEIVPNAELQCDRNVDLMELEKIDKVHSIEKHHQDALQRQKQERVIQKMERHQRRLAREKRKEFLMAEINRLSHQLIVGEDGKMIKAGELLKSITFDGININVVSTKDNNENEDEIEDDENFFEPTVFTYDPRAIVGKSILSERNQIDSVPVPKYVF